MPMLINTRDLSLEEALSLRRVGYNSAYHAVRMGEGVLTDIPLSVRVETLENLSRAGLPLSFCIEPIGEEHTAADVAEKLALHLSYSPLTGGVGRSVDYIARIFEETGWELRHGYSPGWNMDVVL